MPQETQLFSGSVAVNIARLNPQPDPEAVIRAARLAGLHDLILHLPDGYDTEIGEGGALLSGGMRQRWRWPALYGDPVIVVLDEPNSNLDASGDDALAAAIKAVKAAGTTVIMITHRPQSLAELDKVMILQNGAVQSFGARDEVISHLGVPASAVQRRLPDAENVRRPGAPPPANAPTGPAARAATGDPLTGRPASSSPTGPAARATGENPAAARAPANAPKPLAKPGPAVQARSMAVQSVPARALNRGRGEATAVTGEVGDGA